MRHNFMCEKCKSFCMLVLTLYIDRNSIHIGSFIRTCTINTVTSLFCYDKLANYEGI